MTKFADDAPACPLCRSATKLNFGRYGPFYGCTTWRPDDPTSCRGRIKVKPPKVLLKAVLASVEADVPWRWVDLDKVDQMSGSEFEHYLVGLLARAGFRPDRTGGSGDRGADIVVRAPNGELWVIQAKRWQRRIGSPEVSEAVAAQVFYHADHAVVITNHGFTRDAMDWVARTGVELWGRGILATVIRVLEHAAEAPSHKPHD